MLSDSHSGRAVLSVGGAIVKEAVLVLQASQSTAPYPKADVCVPEHQALQHTGLRTVVGPPPK